VLGVYLLHGDETESVQVLPYRMESGLRQVQLYRLVEGREGADIAVGTGPTDGDEDGGLDEAVLFQHMDRECVLLDCRQAGGEVVLCCVWHLDVLASAPCAAGVDKLSVPLYVEDLDEGSVLGSRYVVAYLELFKLFFRHIFSVNRVIKSGLPYPSRTGTGLGFINENQNFTFCDERIIYGCNAFQSVNVSRLMARMSISGFSVWCCSGVSGRARRVRRLTLMKHGVSRYRHTRRMRLMSRVRQWMAWRVVLIGRVRR